MRGFLKIFSALIKEKEREKRWRLSTDVSFPAEMLRKSAPSRRWIERRRSSKMNFVEENGSWVSVPVAPLWRAMKLDLASLENSIIPDESWKRVRSGQTMAPIAEGRAMEERIKEGAQRR